MRVRAAVLKRFVLVAMTMASLYMLTERLFYKKHVTLHSIRRFKYLKFYTEASKHGLVDDKSYSALFDLNEGVYEPEASLKFPKSKETVIKPTIDQDYFKSTGANSVIEQDARYSIPLERLRDKAYLRKSIHSLIAAWSVIAKSLEVYSWISQGLLLSLVLEKKVVSSWDHHGDFEVCALSFAKIARQNNTIFMDRYLLDISPNTQTTDYSNLFEEARFIDMQNGLFLSIWQVYSRKRMFVTRNDMIYDYNDIYPLEKISIDGLELWRPHNSMNILSRTYSEDDE